MLILAFKANRGASKTCTFFQILAYCEVIYCDGGGVCSCWISSALEILFNPYRWKEKAFQMISSVSITLYGTMYCLLQKRPLIFKAKGDKDIHREGQLLL